MPYAETRSVHSVLQTMNLRSRTAHWYVLSLVIFACDQFAKGLIDMNTPVGWLQEVTSFFNLVHALNPGAAFSFLADAGGWQRWAFLTIALAISYVLVLLLSRPLGKMEGFAYSLILGGALGNGFDRLVRGQVVDYLDFHLLGWHWPAFNLADMAIVGGAIAMMIQSLLYAKKTGNADELAPETP